MERFNIGGPKVCEYFASLVGVRGILRVVVSDREGDVGLMQL